MTATGRESHNLEIWWNSDSFFVLCAPKLNGQRNMAKYMTLDVNTVTHKIQLMHFLVVITFIIIFLEFSNKETITCDVSQY